MAQSNDVEKAKERLYRIRSMGGKSEYIDVEMLESQRKAILDFDRHLQATGKKTGRRVKCIDSLRYWIPYLPKKPWEELCRDELEEAVVKLEENRKLKPSTKEGMKVILRQFYTFLEGGEDGIVPKKIKWLHVDMKKYSQRANYQELLTPDEVDLFVDCAPTVMLKLLIKLCYESAFRPHELIDKNGLTMGRIQEDEYGLKIGTSDDTKTGQRWVRIVDSVPLFKEYIRNHHPCPKNPETPLFGYYYGGRWKPITYSNLRPQIANIGHKAKALHPAIRNKRCHLYGLRKARLSAIASVLPETTLKRVAGWTPNSNMCRVYISNSDKAIDDAVLAKVYGVKAIEQEGIKKRVKVCPGCKKENDSSYSLCEYCSRALSGGDAIKLDASMDELRAEVLTLKKTINFLETSVITHGKLEESLRTILREEITSKLNEKVRNKGVLEHS
ncbi:MAG: hypothetical protein ABII71_03435 [Candidatus Micrarchaeota archaeon]